MSKINDIKRCAMSLIEQSIIGGTQKLTISDTIAQGNDQPCCSVLISSNKDIYLQIGATADADDFLIPKKTVIPVPIDNCSKLHFFGSNGDVIRLLWRD